MIPWTSVHGTKAMNWGASRTILRVDVNLFMAAHSLYLSRWNLASPQGSVLGPILFSIYINDLPNCLPQSKILLYADDAVVFYADSNIGNISIVLNKDLKQLQS